MRTDRFVADLAALRREWRLAADGDDRFAADLALRPPVAPVASSAATASPAADDRHLIVSLSRVRCFSAPEVKLSSKPSILNIHLRVSNILLDLVLRVVCALREESQTLSGRSHVCGIAVAETVKLL